MNENLLIILLMEYLERARSTDVETFLPYEYDFQANMFPAIISHIVRQSKCQSETVALFPSRHVRIDRTGIVNRSAVE